VKLDPTKARRRLLEAVCHAAGVDSALLDEPGISVHGEADRAGTGVASAYELDRHLLIRCDPAAVERCRSFVTVDTPSTVEGFESVLPPEIERLGRGFLHVLASSESSVHRDVRPLDTAGDADVSLIGELIAADPDGADAAEIELDGLDSNAVGIVIDGALATFVSERPWSTDPEFADIGVLTHPDHRGLGLAGTALGALCLRVLAAGRSPLYRCDATNVASKALAERVGFVEVARLSAAIL